MVAEISRRPFTSEERAYLWARAVFTVVSVLMFAIGLVIFESTQQAVQYGIGLILLIVVGVMMIAAISIHQPLARIMLIVLPLDLISVALFTASLGTALDPFYQVALGIPVLYALVIPKRQAWVVGVASAAAWGIGHTFTQAWTPTFGVLFFFKLVAIPLITFVVANTVEQQRLREAEVVKARDEKVVLNEELRRRLADLQAVSEITEVIHSTLDFDRVGPVVLEIVAKVIGVASCALFVIDKDRSETMFSASFGMAQAPSFEPGMKEGSTLTDDNHFICMSVFDHRDAGVLFCADADDVEALSEEDRLVLGAVASELVVAVENSRLYKLTRRLAITDELTGLHNYRYLQQRLEEEVERARRYTKQLSLLMMDADDFKHYNDNFGHVAGDVALSQLGHVIRASVRDVDVVCRYGGEEFSVVLPETDSAGAFVVAEKIREAVAHHQFPDAEGKPGTQITVSIGLATFPTHASDRETLLRESDDALYRAKNGGKNRVRTPVRGADKVVAHPASLPVALEPEAETVAETVAELASEPVAEPARFVTEQEA